MYFYRGIGGNGEKIGSSQMYTLKSNARRAARTAIKKWATAEIVED